MTEQNVTTEQAASADEIPETTQTAEQTPAAQATEAPAGTPALRDAQQASAHAADAGRPAIKATNAGTAAASTSPADAPLFDEDAGSQLRERWLVVQTEFVDEPRNAVEKADALVAEVLKQLTDTFAREREELEAGWSGAGDGRGREVSTEDLRMAIQRYRSFFNRLLAL